MKRPLLRGEEGGEEAKRGDQEGAFHGVPN
jgi:hypothetical protein